MPNDLPRFPIKRLPKDFPTKDLTPLKRSQYDFDPSEPRSHSIFRFRYKLRTDHVSIHHWCYELFLLFRTDDPAPGRSSLYDLYWGKFQNRTDMTTYSYL